MSVTDSPSIPYRELRSNLEKIADEGLKEQVSNGIEWLNDHFGADWVDFVDPRSLMLDSCSACVLGQVFDPKKHPENVERIAQLVGQSASEFPGRDGYGVATDIFAEVDDEFDDGAHGFSTSGRYDQLTDAWKTAIWGIVPSE